MLSTGCLHVHHMHDKTVSLLTCLGTHSPLVRAQHPHPLLFLLIHCTILTFCTLTLLPSPVYFMMQILCQKVLATSFFVFFLFSFSSASTRWMAAVTTYDGPRTECKPRSSADTLIDQSLTEKDQYPPLNHSLASSSESPVPSL